MTAVLHAQRFSRGWMGEGGLKPTAIVALGFDCLSMTDPPHLRILGPLSKVVLNVLSDASSTEETRTLQIF